MPLKCTPSKRFRPGSLHDVARQSLVFGGIDALLREFLDEFYKERDPARQSRMLAAEPELLMDDRANAYLAAVAEHLSRCHQLPVAPWVHDKRRFLQRPFFTAGLESLKASQLAESPLAFRRRMIFVGQHPLSRPHHPKEK